MFLQQLHLELKHATPQRGSFDAVEGNMQCFGSDTVTSACTAICCTCIVGLVVRQLCIIPVLACGIVVADYRTYTCSSTQQVVCLTVHSFCVEMVMLKSYYWGEIQCVQVDIMQCPTNMCNC